MPLPKSDLENIGFGLLDLASPEQLRGAPRTQISIILVSCSYLPLVARKILQPTDANSPTESAFKLTKTR